MTDERKSPGELIALSYTRIPDNLQNQIVYLMQQYAEQEAIAFAEWVDDNLYSKTDGGWHCGGWNPGDPEPQFYTTSELYALFNSKR